MKLRPALFGFTLIEMLVALVILAMLSIAGYRGLNAMIQTRDHLAKETRHWQYLSQFFARMEQDISQAVHRPIRDRNGILQPTWVGHPTPIDEEDAELAFTRCGVPDPTSTQFAPQRIAYRFENNSIVMLHWKSLDRAPNAVAVRYPLLEGVREFKLRYMDAVGNWYPQWPISNVGLDLPAAAEASLTLSSGEIITRVFALQ
jgi:general secretion pathway protein J